MILAFDKLLHLAVGSAIAVFCLRLNLGYEIAILASGIAGVLKEFIDRRGFGQKDFLDFFVTLIGGLAGCALWWYIRG